MRFICSALIVLLSSACHHSFPPPDENNNDSANQDRDGAVDLVFLEANRDQPQRDFPIYEAGPLDLAVPDCGAGLGDPVVDSGTGTNCSSLSNWSCKGCGDFHRMVCYINSEIKREIWCDGKECRCKIAGDKVPIPCLDILDNGRFGCKRCVSAFMQGCCKPAE